MKKLSGGDAVKKLEEVIHERESYGRRGPTQTGEELQLQMENWALINHIVTRMNLSENGREFHYVPGKTTLDGSDDDPELPDIPSTVKAISVTRRRHTNIHDVDRAFNELMSGNVALDLQLFTTVLFTNFSPQPPHQHTNNQPNKQTNKQTHTHTHTQTTHDMHKLYN